MDSTGSDTLCGPVDRPPIPAPRLLWAGAPIRLHACNVDGTRRHSSHGLSASGDRGPRYSQHNGDLHAQPFGDQCLEPDTPPYWTSLCHGLIWQGSLRRGILLTYAGWRAGAARIRIRRELARSPKRGSRARFRSRPHRCRERSPTVPRTTTTPLKHLQFGPRRRFGIRNDGPLPGARRRPCCVCGVACQTPAPPSSTDRDIRRRWTRPLRRSAL